jgi:predicted enzyme related to lactoylglutathione lyase
MTPSATPGAPCRVDTFQPDPAAAARFYGALLGWSFDDPQELPSGPYRRARREGRAVAGIGQAPSGLPAAVWSTYVATDDLAAAVERAVRAGASVVLGPVEGSGGRMAVLTDPAGVAFSLWDGPGAELVAAPGAWAMSALHTPDPEAGAAFYGAVFGWQAHAVADAPLWFLRLPGYAGAPARGVPADVVAVMAPTGPGVPPHWAVSLRVDDVDATAAAAVALGGTTVVAPVDAAANRTAAIADPQGGVIALVAPVAADGRG